MTIFLTQPPYLHGQPVAPAEPLYTSDTLSVTVQEIEGQKIEFELVDGLDVVTFPVAVEDLVAALYSASPTFMKEVAEGAQRAILASLGAGD